MTASTLITDYLGRGLLAARPAAPNVAANGLAAYYATDTATLYFYGGSSWTTGLPPGVASFNTRTGIVTLTSGDVTTALGFTPGTGAGTVTGITAGAGLGGGTITTAGTITNAGVLSFNTRTGAITLTAADLTAAMVGNVTNAGTFINTGTITGGTLDGAIVQAATGTLTLSGVATGVSAAVGDNSTNLATTNFVYKVTRNNIASVVTTGGTTTLASTQYGAPQISVSGALASDAVIVLPTAGGIFNVVNGTSGAFTVTFKTAAGSGVGVGQGTRVNLVGDGANIVAAQSAFNNTTLTGTTNFFGTLANSGTISGGTLAGTITNTGTITGGTLAGSITNGGTISGGTLAGTVTMSGTLNSTGLLTATTQAAGDSSTKAATTAFVQAAKRYIVALQMIGIQTSASQLLAVHRFAAAGTFPANFGAIASGEASTGGSTVNATGSTVFNIDQCPAASDPTSGGSWTTIGTATLAASGHAVTLASTSGTAKTYAAADWIRLLGPATADATAANLALTLVGAG